MAAQALVLDGWRYGEVVVCRVELRAWRNDFIDPVEKRTALARCALALRADVLPLITFSFWPEDRQKWEPVWNDLFETLRLAKGQRFKRRN